MEQLKKQGKVNVTYIDTLRNMEGRKSLYHGLSCIQKQNEKTKHTRKNKHCLH